MGKAKWGVCGEKSVEGATEERRLLGEAKGTTVMYSSTIGQWETPVAPQIGLPETETILPSQEACRRAIPPTLYYAGHSPPTTNSSPTFTSRQPCQAAEYVDKITLASSADAPGKPVMAMH